MIKLFKAVLLAARRLCKSSLIEVIDLSYLERAINNFLAYLLNVKFTGQTLVNEVRVSRTTDVI